MAVKRKRRKIVKRDNYIGKNFLLNLLNTATTIGKNKLSAYSNIETAIDNDVFNKHSGAIIIGKDGSAGTIIEYQGSTKMIGRNEIINIVNRLSKDMANMMSSSAHTLQVYFSRNPDDSKALVEDILAPGRTVAKSIGMDLSDLFYEDQNFFPRWISKEDIFFVLWTKPSILSKEENESMERQEMEAEDKDIWRSVVLPEALDTQDPYRVGRMVLQRHRSMVSSFVSSLKAMKFSVRLPDAKESLRYIHDSLYPGHAEGFWQPLIAGTETNHAQWIRESASDNLSALLWPRMDEQLFTEDAEEISGNICRVGSNYFGTVDLHMPPQELQTFLHLLRRVMNQDGGKEFPWRFSMFVDGDGMANMGMKSMLASILAFTTPNGYNNNIKRSIESLRYMIQNGQKIVRVRVSLSTWAPVSSGLQKIEDRILSLSRAVESWGNCEVSSVSGDPVASTMGTVMGIGTGSTAPAFGAPLPDILALLPWQRDVSPWHSGSCLFRTEDGRPFPIELGSSLQNTFNELISAPPGSGKSFWLATTNMAACLSPKATSGVGGFDLPVIRVIDIGPSQRGFTTIIRDSLPAHMKDKVIFRVMRMSKEFAINPFDTPLGSRTPTKLDEQFLKSFLCICATPESGELPDKMSDMIGQIVRSIYRKYSDKERRDISPKKYQRGANYEVDEMLDKITDKPPQFWWGVVDLLKEKAKIGTRFDDSLIRLAYIAQRYAVPNMTDLISFSTESIENAYREVEDVRTNQSIVDSFQTTIQALVSDYEVLAYPTEFDLGNARIAVLDLQGVQGGTGAAGDKQTTIMYMLARFRMASEFYGHKDIINEFNPDYHDFHLPRLERMSETPKRLVFDEFHRTKSSKLMRQQIERDMREGRKFNIQIALASQSLADFDDIYFELASGVWIMGVGSDMDINIATEKLDLSDTAKGYLRDGLGGAKENGGGAPFLACLQMKDKRHEHYLLNTLGPRKIWAFSTTAEDSQLREALYKKMPAAEARAMLAKRFPKGSAKSYIESLAKERAKMSTNDFIDKEQEQLGIIKEIVNELHLSWLQLKNIN